MFSKVLVANRGEIAVRIQQSLQAMGIRTVAVYSDIDKSAPHVMLADEAWPLGGSSPAETYLDIGKMLSIAKQTRCQAVHPGYGFRSESPLFSKACRDAGLVFIGPTPEVMTTMGDKWKAKAAAKAAGVATIPALFLETGVDIEAAARGVGFPLLVKAIAGGGGRGMRLVENSRDLLPNVDSASAEATAAFGNGRVLLERWIPTARHIEVQVLGDSAGNVVHLFERECSIQRRHQKLIEETPSPALDSESRLRVCQSAVAIARQVGYVNAGTLEFLFEPNGSFYFLEMNTRLQVEHSITEAVLGIDLVQEQVRIAAGERLPASLSTIEPRGHAMECRVYAEDPYRGFVPSAGKLLRFDPPAGPGIRVDSGYVAGQTLSTEYDALLCKLTVHAPDRASALERMDWALAHTVVLGVDTNISFLRIVIHHPDFAKGAYDTRFLEKHQELYTHSENAPLRAPAAALAAWLRGTVAVSIPGKTQGIRYSPWTGLGSWRIG